MVWSKDDVRTVREMINRNSRGAQMPAPLNNSESKAFNPPIWYIRQILLMFDDAVDRRSTLLLWGRAQSPQWSFPRIIRAPSSRRRRGARIASGTLRFRPSLASITLAGKVFIWFIESILAVLGGALRAFGQRVVLGSFVGLWLHIKIDGVGEYSERLSQMLVSRNQRLFF